MAGISGAMPPCFRDNPGGFSFLGFDHGHTEGIIMSGQVHDIGNITVPAEILSKPGRLSELEMQIIRDHPLHGRDILIDVDSPLPLEEIDKNSGIKYDAEVSRICLKIFREKGYSLAD
jgi:HD-GYP domain-containing protein (c-di-GMP phosphodiesterase class II)